MIENNFDRLKITCLDNPADYVEFIDMPDQDVVKIYTNMKSAHRNPYVIMTDIQKDKLIAWLMQIKTNRFLMEK